MFRIAGERFINQFQKIILFTTRQQLFHDSSENSCGVVYLAQFQIKFGDGKQIWRVERDGLLALGLASTEVAAAGLVARLDAHPASSSGRVVAITKPPPPSTPKRT